MQIKIDLPISSIFIDDENQNYKTAEGFLKQLELSVHHAQKSLKQMKEMEDENGADDLYSISIRVDDVEYFDGSTTQCGNPGRAYIEINSD